MTYTPAQISIAHGGDVFYFDYEHSDVVQTFTFAAGSWGLYQADNVAVGDSITPAYDDTGISIAGTVLFSVTTQHLDAFASSHVEWDGSGLIVEYTLDGTTWAALPQDGVVQMNGDVDFDIRVSFAGGQTDDPSYLNSLTVYVLEVGVTASGYYRTLSFGTDAITDAGLVTVGGETISPADLDTDLTNTSIEIYAGIGQLGTVVSGSAFSFVVNPDGSTTATGCTAYINGIPSDTAPGLITGVIPYHFIIVPTTAVNEQLTLGAGLTMSNLAIYPQALSSSDALGIYSATVNGMPTLTVDDGGGLAVTEGWVQKNDDGTTTNMPGTDIYAYAWSIVSSGGQ